MEALIVYPKDKEQLAALKAVMRVMKISLEQKSDSIYPAHVINGVVESIRQAEAGELIPYTGIRDMLDAK